MPQPTKKHAAPKQSNAEEKRVQLLIKQSRKLARDCEQLRFAPPTTHVYNPLEYAWNGHLEYLRRYALKPLRKRVLFLGMNPGPWGMAQTGLPFGDVTVARDWMRIETKIGKPSNEHPKRPILGFDCPRSEVSGSRLWNFFAQRYGGAKDFFKHHTVFNYCPLMFSHIGLNSARNINLDQLRADERARLCALCDEFLLQIVENCEASALIGVGQFAERRLQKLFGSGSHRIGLILHPSPASPKANRGFAQIAARQLDALGI